MDFSAVAANKQKWSAEKAQGFMKP